MESGTTGSLLDAIATPMGMYTAVSLSKENREAGGRLAEERARYVHVVHPAVSRTLAQGIFDAIQAHLCVGRAVV